MLHTLLDCRLRVIAVFIPFHIIRPPHKPKKKGKEEMALQLPSVYLEYKITSQWSINRKLILMYFWTKMHELGYSTVFIIPLSYTCYICDAFSFSSKKLS